MGFRGRILTHARRVHAGNSKGWLRQRRPLREDVETVAYHMLNWRKGMHRQSLHYFDMSEQSIQILSFVPIDPSAFSCVAPTVL